MRSSKSGDLRPAHSSRPLSHDRSRSGKRVTRLLALVAAGLGALLLVFLVLRYSVVDALFAASPQAAALLAPDDPRLVLDRAEDEIRSGGQVSAATRAAVEDAFKHAPLSDEPLLIAAQQALARGEEQRADRLVAMAHRRDPRSRYTLALMLEQHLRNARIPETAATMAVLTRLESGAAPMMVAVLARMAMDPRTIGSVREAMESDEKLRTNVLEELARQGADPDKILDLASAGPEQGPQKQAPSWQRLLLEDLVKRGEIAEAHRIWRRLSGAGAAQVPAAVYDPDFAGLPGAPPFNWHFESGSDGFAEITRGSPGLYAEYHSRSPMQLGGQLLLLPPGRYSLGFTAEGTSEGEEGHLAWTLSCHPGERQIGEVPITGVGYSAKSISGEFSVPAAGCPAQWLRLTGKAAEFPKQEQVTIRSLRISRVDRQ